MKILVTGSSGLIGSETVAHFDGQGHDLVGIDNNLRQVFFGPEGDTSWNLARLMKATRNFRHLPVDIRDRAELDRIFAEERFDVVIHCAAQPSHDKARDFPLVDFDVNAVGTLNLLEACRRHSPEAVFIFMSTNKVYGDAPNEIPLVELETRWDYARPEDHQGVDENCRIDRSLHSIFGASKAAADIVAQEYGRYFGMRVGVFRGGCLTGPGHSGVELHGFLAYLVKAAVNGIPYRVYGHKGKQVRDQIHSRDVVAAFEAFIRSPRGGEVYNLGGGRGNNASVLESIQMVERASGRHLNWTYVDEPRIGDHICYISNLGKLTGHFPEWHITVTVEKMIEEMVEATSQHATPGGVDSVPE
jgi:CDP-paratose 2-epimerase